MKVDLKTVFTRVFLAFGYHIKKKFKIEDGEEANINLQEKWGRD